MAEESASTRPARRRPRPGPRRRPGGHRHRRGVAHHGGDGGVGDAVGVADPGEADDDGDLVAVAPEGGDLGLALSAVRGGISCSRTFVSDTFHWRRNSPPSGRLKTLANDTPPLRFLSP